MDTQWLQLRAVLNGEHDEKDGISGQFFYPPPVLSG